DYLTTITSVKTPEGRGLVDTKRLVRKGGAGGSNQVGLVAAARQRQAPALKVGLVAADRWSWLLLPCNAKLLLSRWGWWQRPGGAGCCCRKQPGSYSQGVAGGSGQVGLVAAAANNQAANLKVGLVAADRWGWLLLPGNAKLLLSRQRQTDALKTTSATDTTGKTISAKTTSGKTIYSTTTSATTTLATTTSATTIFAKTISAKTSSSTMIFGANAL
ncbi:unnamed protein product, partial [Timema podura]|nr:unnamed protein product [Timema podura]